MPEKRINKINKNKSQELPNLRDSACRPFARSTTVSSFDGRFNLDFKEPRRRPSVKKLTSAAILKLKELRFRSKTQKNNMFVEKSIVPQDCACIAGDDFISISLGVSNKTRKPFNDITNR
ncbi:unnamed protein product [Oikopleura dioica]|uniref:Uncharacterized protein n=1 Tax=Oikopleura dioica TaxID=34765 RepID=E4XBY2_OIKDI|nr:unnamed protein product [Oikopleura dioica]CBY37895.1 unnamed protein product [Oikopleura dioica]CBY40097.1 unnamed protein product [Oikopleura dioica]